MSRRRLRPVLSVLLPLVLFAGACGNDDESAGPTATTSAIASTESVEETTAPPESSAPADTSEGADTSTPGTAPATSDEPVELDDSDPVTILFVAGFTGPTSVSVADAELGMRARDRRSGGDRRNPRTHDRARDARHGRRSDAGRQRAPGLPHRARQARLRRTRHLQRGGACARTGAGEGEDRQHEQRSEPGSQSPCRTRITSGTRSPRPTS